MTDTAQTLVRFDMVQLLAGQQSHFPVAAPEGEWVKFAEAAAQITRLTAEVERLTRERDEAREWASGWHACVEFTCSLFGLHAGLGASEFNEAIRELAALRTRTTEAQEG